MTVSMRGISERSRVDSSYLCLKIYVRKQHSEERTVC